MIDIRPMTAADFERFWPTFKAVVRLRKPMPTTPP